MRLLKRKNAKLKGKSTLYIYIPLKNEFPFLVLLVLVMCGFLELFKSCQYGYQGN